MKLAGLAVFLVALVGLWCLVVIPAMWLSGTLSEAEDATDLGTDETDAEAEPEQETPDKAV